MVVGEVDQEDLDVNTFLFNIIIVSGFRYVDVTFTTSGDSTQGITNKIGKEKGL